MFGPPNSRSSLRGGLLVLTAVLSVSAGSVPNLSIEDLVTQSEMIVSGTVTRSYTGWDTEHRFIWTHSELAVDGVWKGTPGRVVTISEPGGIADGLGMQIPGSTSYTAGEHVAVFLRRTPLTYLRTTGSGQGKFLLSKEGKVHPAEGGNLDGLSIDQFQSRVRQVMADQAQGKVR